MVLATREYVDNLITATMTAHEKSTNHPNASTKSKGFVQLNSAIDSNLENQAATPLAVKKVNDNVNYAHARINDVHEYAKSINNEVISAHNRISQVHGFSINVNERINSIVDTFQPDYNETRMYSHDKRFYIVIRDDGTMGMYSHVKNDIAWFINHEGWFGG